MKQAKWRCAGRAWAVPALLVLGACGSGGSSASSSPSAAYGANVSAGAVDPCRLLTAAEADDALAGSKYTTGNRTAGTTGVPLCEYKDEALGGFINILVQDFPSADDWRQASARALNYQVGSVDNGPWDAGTSGCFDTHCEVAFLIGTVGVTILAVPGANQTVEGDYTAGLGVLARKAASRFKRTSADSGAP